MEDEACNRQLQHFPKFRALAKEVEACLQVFEHAKDWSDYVSGLTRLIKVLQRAEFCDAAKVGDLSVIPDKATIARRLAQSVNPILPNGVHRKALDAYRVILSRLGRDQLALDLSLWSQGLFSLFPHANEECKLFELKLLADSFLPLGPHLIPCLDGLLLALLPGIEDEQTSFYQPSLVLLQDIHAAVGRREFFRSLWWSLQCCVGARLPSLFLLHSSIAQAGGLHVPGVLSCRDTVVDALIKALQDSSILVQRSVLDLLLAHLPFMSPLLSHQEGGAREGGHEDGAQAWRLLTSAALRLYARRDMSLTRRLHSWLSAVWTTAADAQVQVEVGRESVTWAINKLLAEAFTDALSATAPFRVARAVLDKTVASPGGGEAAGGGGIIGGVAVALLGALFHSALLADRSAKHAHETGDGRNVARERYLFARNTLRDVDVGSLWRALFEQLRDAAQTRPSLALNPEPLPCTSDDPPTLPVAGYLPRLRLASFFFDEFILRNESGYGKGSGTPLAGGCRPSCVLVVSQMMLSDVLSLVAIISGALAPAAPCKDERQTELDRQVKVETALQELIETLRFADDVLSFLSSLGGGCGDGGPRAVQVLNAVAKQVVTLSQCEQVLRAVGQGLAVALSETSSLCYALVSTDSQAHLLRLLISNPVAGRSCPGHVARPNHDDNPHRSLAAADSKTDSRTELEKSGERTAAGRCAEPDLVGLIDGGGMRGQRQTCLRGGHTESSQGLRDERVLSSQDKNSGVSKDWHPDTACPGTASAAQTEGDGVHQQVSCVGEQVEQMRPGIEEDGLQGQGARWDAIMREASELPDATLACLGIKARWQLWQLEVCLEASEADAGICWQRRTSRLGAPGAELLELMGRLWSALDEPDANTVACDVIFELNAMHPACHDTCRSLISSALLGGQGGALATGLSRPDATERREVVVRGMRRFACLWRRQREQLQVASPGRLVLWRRQRQQVSATALPLTYQTSGWHALEAPSTRQAGLEIRQRSSSSLVKLGILLLLDCLGGDGMARHHHVRLAAESEVAAVVREEAASVFDPVILLVLSVCESTKALIDTARVRHALSTLSNLVRMSGKGLGEPAAARTAVSRAVLAADKTWLLAISNVVRHNPSDLARTTAMPSSPASAHVAGATGNTALEGEEVGGDKAGESWRKETVNELWLRQQWATAGDAAPADQARTGWLQEIGNGCDYLTAVVIMASRLLTMSVLILPHEEALHVMRAASEVIVAVFATVSPLSCLARQGVAGASYRASLIDKVALPLLQRLQAALVDHDSCQQVILLDLLNHLLSSSDGLLVSGPPGPGFVLAADVGEMGGGVVPGTPRLGAHYGASSGASTGGDRLGVARQLLLRLLVAAMDEPACLRSCIGDAWLSVLVTCVAVHTASPVPVMPGLHASTLSGSSSSGLLTAPVAPRHDKHDLFVIPLLTSLCKRLVSVSSSPCIVHADVVCGACAGKGKQESAAGRCNHFYSVKSSHVILSLLQAVSTIFKRSLPAVSADVEGIGQGHLQVGTAGGSVSSAQWSFRSLFRHTEAGVGGGVAGVSDDSGIEAMLKLLAPAGWIPQSAGTCSVMGALLSVWGPSPPASSKDFILAAASGGSHAIHHSRMGSQAACHFTTTWVENQGKVRRSLIRLIHGLLAAYPMQTLAAFLQVWETQCALARAIPTTGFQPLPVESPGIDGNAGLPLLCEAIVDILVTVSSGTSLDHATSELGEMGAGLRQGIVPEDILRAISDLMLQAVRRRHNQIAQRLKYTESSAIHLLIAFLHRHNQSHPGGGGLDCGIRALASICGALKETLASSRDAEIPLHLLHLLHVYMATCPLPEAKQRTDLIDCVHLAVGACLGLVQPEANISSASSASSSSWSKAWTASSADLSSTSSSASSPASVNVRTKAASGGAVSLEREGHDLTVNGCAPKSTLGTKEHQDASWRHDVSIAALRALSRHLAFIMERLWKDAEEGVGGSSVLGSGVGAAVLGGGVGGAHGLTMKVLLVLAPLLRASSSPLSSSAPRSPVPESVGSLQVERRGGDAAVATGGMLEQCSEAGREAGTKVSTSKTETARRPVSTLMAVEAVAILASLNHPIFIKSWRKEVLMVFNDAKFFVSGIAALPSWALLVDVAMSQESGAFADLLAAGPSGGSGNVLSGMNVFSGLEAKYRQHDDHIRRLAYVLLAGEPDQYAPWLPQILERLLEALKLPSGSDAKLSRAVVNVQQHVFLCFQVLLMRLTGSNLVSLWPIVLSEAAKVLHQATVAAAAQRISAAPTGTSIASNGTGSGPGGKGLAGAGNMAHDSELWERAFAALSFLDFALFLEPEQLQMMQWALVQKPPLQASDTQPDVPSDDYPFKPLVTCLALGFQALPGRGGEQGQAAQGLEALLLRLDADEASDNIADWRQRRPVLSGVRVEDMHELSLAAALLHAATSHSVRHVHSSKNVDEASIIADLLQRFDDLHPGSLSQTGLPEFRACARQASPIHALALCPTDLILTCREASAFSPS